MRDLKTHRLMPLPEGRKAIGSRWVLSVKSDEDGNVTRHKARFVAQGYTQVEGIDYCHIHISTLLIRTSGPQIRSDPIHRSISISVSILSPLPIHIR
jgi:hypothetical protein